MNTVSADHADRIVNPTHLFGITDPTWDRMVTLSIILLATALRLVHLGREGLWADECHTAYWGGHDIGWIIGASAVDTQAPLYFILNSAFIRTLGDAEWQIRLLSALAGVAAVGLMLGWGRRFLSPTAGRLAAFLLAISPMAIHYGREARGYSLMMLVCLGLGWVAFVAVKEPTYRLVAAVAGLALVLMYLHNIGPFYVAGIALATIVRHPTRETLRLWIAVGTIVALGYAPWLPRLLAQVAEISTSFTWAAESWSNEFPWQVPRSLAAFTHGSYTPIRNQISDLPYPAWIALTLCCVLAIAGLMGRRRLRRPDAPAMLLMAVLFPLIAVFFYSWMSGNRVYVIGRIDSPLLPLFLLAVAAGVESLRPRLRWILPVAFAGLAIHPIEIDLRIDTKSQERSIASMIEAVREPGEILVSTTFNTCMIHYGNLEFGQTLFPYPSTVSDRLEWTDWSSFSDLGLRIDAATVVQRAVENSRASGSSKIWLLIGGDARGDTMAKTMNEMLDPISTRMIGYQHCEIRSFAVPQARE